jgi:sugar phosphate isomerase/epimerase
MNRRDFLQSGLVLTAGTMLPAFAVAPGFSIQFMATDWGFNGSIDDFCAAAKKEGYDGVEVWWPQDAVAQKKLFDALDKHQLKVGFLCGGWQADPKEHLQTFRNSIIAASSNSRMKPLYINCHSGRDYFSFAENLSFIRFTTETTQKTGIQVYHETHRGRMCYSAPVTRKFLEAVPEMRLTLDISHWCTVHESLLADQAATVNLALERAEHIHSRIGHPEGPQVNDPRAPEWENTVKQHLIWWDTIINRKKQKGEPMTILTEFGPADYMPTLPYTRQPLANQWEINVYMMRLLKARYMGN